MFATSSKLKDSLLEVCGAKEALEDGLTDPCKLSHHIFMQSSTESLGVKRRPSKVNRLKIIPDKDPLAKLDDLDFEEVKILELSLSPKRRRKRRDPSKKAKHAITSPNPNVSTSLYQS